MCVCVCGWISVCHSHFVFAIWICISVCRRFNVYSFPLSDSGCGLAYGAKLLAVVCVPISYFPGSDAWPSIHNNRKDTSSLLHQNCAIISTALHLLRVQVHKRIIYPPPSLFLSLSLSLPLNAIFQLVLVGWRASLVLSIVRFFFILSAFIPIFILPSVHIALVRLFRVSLSFRALCLSF